jgi:hypothetical protein
MEEKTGLMPPTCPKVARRIAGEEKIRQLPAHSQSEGKDGVEANK